MPRGARTGDTGITIDTRDLSRLARDLRGTDRSLERSLKRRVREAAQPVRDAVRSEAASFSRRIPAAVATRATYGGKGATVKVVVNAGRAPHARAINNHDAPGAFRHPVFDQRGRNRRVWVSQAAHNFMRLGSARAAPRAIERVAAVYADVARAAGFH